jgi:hypothetical protein
LKSHNVEERYEKSPADWLNYFCGEPVLSPKRAVHHGQQVIIKYHKENVFPKQLSCLAYLPLLFQIQSEPS